ncbi:M50 family metallopeptidase [Dendrosporobacter sp. 1207_IL3150]|uniref:M50 family metallopeptidase n=1 Tax=Dendrosporobacter sp. 1207_IL3150 TaxID=3084054 RepID=UPI002FD8D671
MRVGKVGNIQLILNNWFIALIALFSLVGMAGKVLLVFSAVLWHETFHAVMAIILGYKVREIELLPFGGVARIDRLGEASAKSEILMAAAGPAASLVLAAAVYIMINQFKLSSDIAVFFYETNLMLALFNLIPALPLDGGRIFRAFLSCICEYTKATLITANISKCISFGLIAFALYDYVSEGLFNISLTIAAVFLYVAARAEIKIIGYRTMRLLANKKADLSSRGFMTTTHYTVMTGTAVRDIVRLFNPEKYYILLVLDDEFSICGTLTETEVWEALPRRGYHAKIGEFLQQ